MKWLTEKRIWEMKRQARMKVKAKVGRLGKELTIGLRHPDCFMRFQRGEYAPDGIIGDVHGMKGDKFFFYYISLLQVTPSIKITLI
jgi:hypothetical protein